MTEPNLRIAGQKGYELQPGESLDTLVAPDFRALLAKAVYGADTNRQVTVQLMFEVSQ